MSEENKKAAIAFYEKALNDRDVETAFRLYAGEYYRQHNPLVNDNHDVIVYTVNSIYLVQNMPNAKLILYPDANHGSWYQNHEDFVFETNRFLNASDVIVPVVTNAAAV